MRAARAISPAIVPVRPQSRKARPEQRQCEAGGVLIGVQPDHQQPEQPGQRPPRPSRLKPSQSLPGMHHGCKSRDGRTKHHPLGAEVDDAGLFVHQQTQPAMASTVPALSVAAIRSANCSTIIASTLARGFDPVRMSVSQASR